MFNKVCCALIGLFIGVTVGAVLTLSAPPEVPPPAVQVESPAEHITVEVVWPDVVIEAAPGDTEPYVFQVGDHTCVAYQGALECFCPCETSGCDADKVVQGFGYADQPVTETPDAGEQPDSDDDGKLSERPDVDTPDTPNEPPRDPTDDDDDVLPPTDPDGGDDDGDNTPVDPPTDDGDQHRHRCDQGPGNGGEGCSPGNSDRNHDPNDEGGPNRGGQEVPKSNPPGDSPGQSGDDHGGGNDESKKPKKVKS